MTEELKLYREYLEKLVESNSTDIFMNGGIDHANVVLSTLFDNTHRNILMYSNGLDQNGVAGKKQYQESLLKCIEQVGFESLKIILRSRPASDNELFKKLSDHEKVNIVFVESISDHVIFDEYDLSECNFSVFDNTMFRLEYEPKNYKAAGSFNAVDKAKRLSTIFNTEYSRLDSIKITL